LINRSSPLKTFIFKISIFSLPFLLLFLVYIGTDPFKVLYRYQNYYPPREHQYIILNRDRITTESLIRNYPLYLYDSYIFGNSRSYFYRTNEWSKLINSNKIFHFNANDESLYGVVQKLKYIDDNKLNFSNALFVFDSGLLKQDAPNTGHLFIKHPVYTHQSWIEYHTEFLKAFFEPRFLIAYLDLLITGTFKGYMRKVMSDKIYDYNLAHNELFLNDEELKIEKDSIGYYQKKKKVFYTRTPVKQYDASILKMEQQLLLKELSFLLSKNRVNFKIIISPLYDQKKMNAADFKYLQKLFGAENVFDFSGQNAITASPGNYYEDSHYRTFVATQLMQSVYGKVRL